MGTSWTGKTIGKPATDTGKKRDTTAADTVRAARKALGQLKGKGSK